VTPDDWQAVTPGLGSCFHRALHRWALLRQEGRTAKVAIGVVAANELDDHRHLHAWLQDGDAVMSAVTGEMYDRATFYHRVGVERRTVALVNPRSIMRATKGIIDRETVRALLDASGIAWRTNEQGGVLPK
jgi:hypothetical protein